MPKLWNDTIETHRRAVRDATLDTTAALVASHGLRSVTMSEIAERTGIGRATLYKYFPDVEAILAAWHARQISAHLAQLTAARDRASGPLERLRAVLEAYAAIAHDSPAHHDVELAAVLHRDPRVAHAEHGLRQLVRALIAEASANGAIRSDIAPDELLAYCLHAVGAARDVQSGAALRRLVGLTLDGLRPQA